MIIDARDLIAGRLASYAAKRALLGEEVGIINSELAVITGSKKVILRKYRAQDERGEPFHGPFQPKTPDRFLKRIIRGMISYKKGKGLLAFKRIKCYNGVPDVFKDKKAETIGWVNINNTNGVKSITIGELCQEIKRR